MLKDIVLVFDKKNNSGRIFGEIQKNFNMSFTIDGTKDSSKMIVHSFDGEELEPYTILLHYKTNTWWIVCRDKVERYENEGGHYYIHNLMLDGAVELLNARDLTDCGFNQNRYTLEDFLTRLFSLSNFEYDISFNTSINLNEKVTFVKTFENYTLLSAVTEFLDAYNCSCVLDFNADLDFDEETFSLLDATLTIIPKSGDIDKPTLSVNYFTDIREIKMSNKENFGACVVSNAENVISNKAKIFPSIGAVRPSSKEFNILAQNAVIRLPSPVYKGLWIKFVGEYSPIQIKVNTTTVQEYFNPCDITSIDALLEEVRVEVENRGNPAFTTLYNTSVNNKRQLIYDFIFKAGSATFYNGNSVNPITQEIVQGADVPYLTKVEYLSKWEIGNNNIYGHPYKPLIFCDKEIKETLPKTYQGIQWERGSNEITGFDAFVPDTGQQGYLRFGLNDSDLHGQSEFIICDDGNGNVVKIEWVGDASTLSTHFRKSSWVVAYIPMSDIKIKVDNARTKKDIHLYNQNGKITDNFALSKLLNSYSKEISSNEITLYKQITDADLENNPLDYVAMCGRIVKRNNENYVISNVSIDFTQCESNDPSTFNYFMDCAFTLCKYVSTKSLMVSPNTNIRDYGIPQYFNVKRKQLFRDYYELNYQSATDREWDYYLSPKGVFNFNNFSKEEADFTAIMKIEYAIEVESSYVYYYQLQTTNYYMSKLMCVILDFNDNNIIGYGSQNVFSGFQVERIFSGMTDTLNTPISYVDSNGEFEDITIIFATNELMSFAYGEYEQAHSEDEDYQDWKDEYGTLYNYSVFIPEELYEHFEYYESVYSESVIKVEFADYNKDAIEVPVFEYLCQVADSVDVLIGDNILTQYQDCIYMYSYVYGNDLTQETAYTNASITKNNDVLSLNNAVSITLSHSIVIIPPTKYSLLRIKLYASQSYNLTSNELINNNSQNITKNKDIAVFRHAYNKTTNTETKELMFILKNVTEIALVDAQTINVELNHYKLN